MILQIIRKIWCWLENKPISKKAIFPCTKCGKIHIDKGYWKIKPHRNHLCEYCGNIWNPISKNDEDFNTPTIGVSELKLYWTFWD